MLKKSLWILLGILLIIQFFRPAKNQSAEAQPAVFLSTFHVPDSISQILQRSCNDCHTNNTRYPWYFSIQPVAWWMQNHVEDGKRELNFSDFAGYPAKKQFRKFREIARQVKSEGMPLDSYTWIHRDAVLSQTEKLQVEQWADSVGTSIKAKNSLPDEPERPRRD